MSPYNQGVNGNIDTLSLQKRHLSSAECILNRPAFSEGNFSISRGDMNGKLGHVGPIGPGTAGNQFG
jgi:hypothetical protein